MDPKAEQYYPTYKAKNRDILLLEFEEAQRIANGQSKIYAQVTNILLAAATLSFTVLFSQGESDESSISKANEFNDVAFVVVLFVFGAILLRYFVTLQKQITINARKVVTLRTLLGLDYGHITLTLPNWRVEGATNPFVIRYFNGWLNFKSMPFWLLTVSVNAIWWQTTQGLKPFSVELGHLRLVIGDFWGYIWITVTYFWVFRTHLNDRHETNYLNIVRSISYLLRIELLDNFEYVLYRAKLAYLELDRLNVEYQVMFNLLVDIEDQEFHSHNGVSTKSLLRGLLSRFGWLRKRFGYIEHGGSTLTMQLVRTLFLPSNQNKYLRKIVELLLALWYSRQFSKVETLKQYVACVRYEKSVLGLSQAVTYFFGPLENRKLSNEEAFFLVERLSNVTSTVRWDRIKYLVTRTSVLIDMEELRKVYQLQVKAGRLRFSTT